MPPKAVGGFFGNTSGNMKVYTNRTFLSLKMWGGTTRYIIFEIKGSRILSPRIAGAVYVIFTH